MSKTTKKPATVDYPRPTLRLHNKYQTLKSKELVTNKSFDSIIVLIDEYFLKQPELQLSPYEVGFCGALSLIGRW